MGSKIEVDVVKPPKPLAMVDIDGRVHINWTEVERRAQDKRWPDHAWAVVLKAVKEGTWQAIV